MTYNTVTIPQDKFDIGPEYEKGQPPSIGPSTSVCGVRAFINAADAKGLGACWRCGLFHGGS